MVSKRWSLQHTVERLRAYWKQPLHGFIPPATILLFAVVIGILPSISGSVAGNVLSGYFGSSLVFILTLAALFLYYDRFRRTQYLQDLFVASALLASIMFVAASLYTMIRFNSVAAYNASATLFILESLRLLTIMLLLYAGLFMERVIERKTSNLLSAIVVGTTVLVTSFSILWVIFGTGAGTPLSGNRLPSISFVFLFSLIPLVVFYAVLSRFSTTERTRWSVLGLSAFSVLILLSSLIALLSDYAGSAPIYYSYTFVWMAALFPLWGILLDFKADSEHDIQFERQLSGLMSWGYNSPVVSVSRMSTDAMNMGTAILGSYIASATVFIYTSNDGINWKIRGVSSGDHAPPAVREALTFDVRALIPSGNDFVTLSKVNSMVPQFSKIFGQNCTLCLHKVEESVYLMMGFSTEGSRITFNDEIRKLEKVTASLAAQLKGMLESERRERMNLRLLAVIEMVRKLIDVKEESAIYTSICREITDKLGFMYVSIWEVGKDERVHLRSWDWPEEMQHLLSTELYLEKGKGIIGTVALSGRPYLANDVSRDPFFTDLNISDARSEFAVPVLMNGRCIAVLDIESPDVNSFDSYDCDIIVILSNIMSMSLKNIELYRSIEENERLTELRSQMLIHDIKNLFQSITLNLELFKKRSFQTRQITDSDIRLIENVSAGLSKGNNFANTVMELLKLSYKRETVRENYSLYSVVSSAISNVRASMYPRKIELETDIDPRAAEITASKMVEQVFINLFTNSCKYNRNDVVKLVLRSYPVENGERRLVGVEIRDNGTGIDSSDPDAIFDRFNTAAKGTGLGLSLVRAIMRSADGDISIKETSTEGTGSGTTFVLTFVSPVSQIEKVIAK